MQVTTLERHVSVQPSTSTARHKIASTPVSGCAKSLRTCPQSSHISGHSLPL